MTTILCYGDSNTWGAVPGPSDPTTGLSQRHPKNQRWTGILQNLLGENFHVIEEGLNGRTTSLDPLPSSKKPFTNGLLYLPFVLESHYPIDLVIFMLGSNDTKSTYEQTAIEICKNMKNLISLVKKSNKGPLGKAPKIILISPPPILKLTNAYPQFNQESLQISTLLAQEYRQLAMKEEITFLDGSLIASFSEVDGLHLDASSSNPLAKAV